MDLLRQNYRQMLTKYNYEMDPFFGQLVDEDQVGFEKARPNAPKRDSHIPVNSRSHIRRCVSIGVSKLAMTFKSGYGEGQVNLNRPKNIFSECKPNHRAFRW